MFNPADIGIKYSYKAETKYQLLVEVFAAFQAEHPNAFVTCQGEGVCFTDFAVFVAPCYGELKFQKGNTNEDSDEPLEEEEVQ
jgi:hypothetical protein